MRPAATGRLSWIFAVLASTVFAWHPAALAAQLTAATVQPNDNRVAAGTRSDNTVTVNLVVSHGEWSPDGPGSTAVPVQAFGEEGGPLTTPGPLLRVPAGTEMVVSIRNDEEQMLVVHGLYTRPAEADEVLEVPPGETRTARFEAGEPGTYFYYATTTGRPLGQRTDVDSQLHGAFVVDGPGAQPNDRVLVLSEWIEPGTPAGERPQHAAFTINGQAWPNTERFEAKVGETFEWRWVNPSLGVHPLHLHGSFYDVVATGNLLQDNLYTPDQVREVVTEPVPSPGTMRMRVTPEAPGNWLFHCHIAAHISPQFRGPSAAAAEGDADHAVDGMGGMTLGIHVTGDPILPPPTLPTRELTMYLDRMPSYFGPGNAAIAVSFGDEGEPATVPTVPGPPLLLTRGQAVRINVVNRLQEATQIHWHGMELESYNDGVAGFSGTNGSLTPPIPPGSSFEVHFTPPRSGTFIYHTHMSDEHQLASGLYGAMIVSNQEEPFDPERDKIFLVGLYGSYNPVIMAINGSQSPEMELHAGVPYRMRLINMTANNAGFNVTLTSPRAAVTWKPVAKDGGDLPAAQQTPEVADRLRLAVGETFDFEWQAPTPGPYWLEVRRGNGEWMGQVALTVLP